MIDPLFIVDCVPLVQATLCNGQFVPAISVMVYVPGTIATVDDDPVPPFVAIAELPSAVSEVKLNRSSRHLKVCLHARSLRSDAYRSHK